MSSTKDTLVVTQGALEEEKKFVRERDHLLAQHKAFEAVLQSQAKSLSQELEEASTQIAALYEKVID